jgi:hypothetical protein
VSACPGQNRDTHSRAVTNLRAAGSASAEPTTATSTANSASGRANPTVPTRAVSPSTDSSSGTPKPR